MMLSGSREGDLLRGNHMWKESAGKFYVLKHHYLVIDCSASSIAHKVGSGLVVEQYFCQCRKHPSH